MKYTFHIADGFSSAPFGGVQLAVLPDAAGISPEGMQKIAGEFNSTKGPSSCSKSIHDRRIAVKIMMNLMAILIGVVALVSGANASENASNKAGGQDERGYANGPVTEVDYIHVEYGHFDEYIAWVTSTWVPTMEAAKKAGLIIDYKVFRASPKSPDQPNVYLEITFKNMAAYAGDIGDGADAFEAVTEKVICNSACQNQARVHRNEIRRVLGTEVIREVVFK